MESIIYPTPQSRTCESIYFVSSPYHVLLAHILASGEPTKTKSILVMKEKRENFFDMFVSIRNDKDTPFEEVLFLKQPATGKLNKSSTVIKQRAQLAGQLISKLQPKKIYIFNDTYLDQFLAYVGKRFQATIYYVEDGAIAYSTNKKRVSQWTHFKNRLIYGDFFNEVAIEGTSANIDYILAAYPDHVRKEFPPNKVMELPKTGGSIFQKLRWPKTFLSSLEVSDLDNKYDSFYVFGYSGLFRSMENYPSALSSIVKSTVNENFNSAVKYHPREKQADYLSLGPLGLNVIHKSVPAEILYYLNNNKLKFIYGDIGTSLITARWFLPNCRVISFMESLGIEDHSFKNLLHQIGVELL